MIVRPTANYQGDNTAGFQSSVKDNIEPVINLPRLLDLRCPGLDLVRMVGQGNSVRAASMPATA